jgi:hypothetical protein
MMKVDREQNFNLPDHFLKLNPLQRNEALRLFWKYRSTAIEKLQLKPKKDTGRIGLALFTMFIFALIILFIFWGFIFRLVDAEFGAIFY